jgi:hypothetical protein
MGGNIRGEELDRGAEAWSRGVGGWVSGLGCEGGWGWESGVQHNTHTQCGALRATATRGPTAGGVVSKGEGGVGCGPAAGCAWGRCRAGANRSSCQTGYARSCPARGRPGHQCRPQRRPPPPRPAASPSTCTHTSSPPPPPWCSNSIHARRFGGAGPGGGLGRKAAAIMQQIAAVTPPPGGSTQPRERARPAPHTRRATAAASAHHA